MAFYRIKTTTTAKIIKQVKNVFRGNCLSYLNTDYYSGPQRSAMAKEKDSRQKKQTHSKKKKPHGKKKKRAWGLGEFLKCTMG